MGRSPRSFAHGSGNSTAPPAPARRRSQKDANPRRCPNLQSPPHLLITSATPTRHRRSKMQDILPRTPQRPDSRSRRRADALPCPPCLAGPASPAIRSRLHRLYASPNMTTEENAGASDAGHSPAKVTHTKPQRHEGNRLSVIPSCCPASPQDTLARNCVIRTDKNRRGDAPDLAQAYSAEMNSSTDTPACFRMPASVPVLSSRWFGTTQPADPRRRTR